MSCCSIGIGGKNGRGGGRNFFWPTLTQFCLYTCLHRSGGGGYTAAFRPPPEKAFYHMKEVEKHEYQLGQERTPCMVLILGGSSEIGEHVRNGLINTDFLQCMVLILDGTSVISAHVRISLI